jgi:invasion protein IalB
MTVSNEVPSLETQSFRLMSQYILDQILPRLSNGAKRVALIPKALAAFCFTLVASVAEAQPEQFSESYGDWVVFCGPILPEAPQANRCEMSQELRQDGTDQLVLAISIQVDEDGAAGRAMIIAPFGLRLANGLRFVMEEREIAAASFETCLPNGCISRTVLTSEAINAFRQGSDARVITTANSNGAEVPIGISLAGFSAAWDRLLAL